MPRSKQSSSAAADAPWKALVIVTGMILCLCVALILCCFTDVLATTSRTDDKTRDGMCASSQKGIVAEIRGV